MLPAFQVHLQDNMHLRQSLPDIHLQKVLSPYRKWLYGSSLLGIVNSFIQYKISVYISAMISFVFCPGIIRTSTSHRSFSSSERERSVCFLPPLGDNTHSLHKLLKSFSWLSPGSFIAKWFYLIVYRFLIQNGLKKSCILTVQIAPESIGPDKTVHVFPCIFRYIVGSGSIFFRYPFTSWQVKIWPSPFH